MPALSHAEKSTIALIKKKKKKNVAVGFMNQARYLNTDLYDPGLMRFYSICCRLFSVKKWSLNTFHFVLMQSKDFSYYDEFFVHLLVYTASFPSWDGSTIFVTRLLENSPKPTKYLGKNCKFWDTYLP